jgi:tetratricopeptide (TPR) repeat protein
VLPWFLLLFFADAFDAAYRAGLAALDSNDLRAAESRLESASKIDPRNAGVWLALAQTYRKLEKTQAAQAAAGTAESLAKEPAVLHGLAIFYSEASDFAKAAQLEGRYARSDPRAYPAAADLYLRAGDEAAAVSVLKTAIERSPYDEQLYFNLAQLHLKQQNFTAALEALVAGRKIFDKSAQLELAAGVAYYGLRRFPEAIESFLRTIRLDPGAEQPYVFLGRMLDQAEDKLPKIVEAFAGFAKSAPDQYLSSFLYGKALAASEPQEAEAMFRKSILRNSQFWESRFELGLLLESEHRFEDAAAELRRAAELNPKDPAIHYRLARVYDRLGKTAEARSEREQYAKLNALGPGVK